jgi:hypothetical protein
MDNVIPAMPELAVHPEDAEVAQPLAVDAQAMVANRPVGTSRETTVDRTGAPPP